MINELTRRAVDENYENLRIPLRTEVVVQIREATPGVSPMTVGKDRQTHSEVAQGTEQRVSNPTVAGSNPALGADHFGDLVEALDDTGAALGESGSPLLRTTTGQRGAQSGYARVEAGVVTTGRDRCHFQRCDRTVINAKGGYA